MILALLMQVSLMQTYVDQATRELAIPPLTVVESTTRNSYAWTNGVTVFLNPFVARYRAPVFAVQFIAYHEACHVALGHTANKNPPFIQAGGNDPKALAKWARRRETDSDICAINAIGDRGNDSYKRWIRWGGKHPIK